MIIGRRGAGIRKIMADYKVDIKLPREKDPDPDLVQVRISIIFLTFPMNRTGLNHKTSLNRTEWRGRLISKAPILNQIVNFVLEEVFVHFNKINF